MAGVPGGLPIHSDPVPPEVQDEMDRVYGKTTTGKPIDKAVVMPHHYARYAIEPVYFIGQNNLNFLKGNIVKYTLRAEHKHRDQGRQDMLKVIRYSFMEAKRLLGDPNWAGQYHNESLERLIEDELSHGT